MSARRMVRRKRMQIMKTRKGDDLMMIFLM